MMANQGSAAVKRVRLCRIAQMRYSYDIGFLNLRGKSLDLATQAVEGLPRLRFTVPELEAMVAASILDENKRIELIGGEVVPLFAPELTVELC
jgi:hypothetical protein